MGIIKTAIVSGVGIYGIRQLSKTVENRQSNPGNDSSRDSNNYPPQGLQQGPGYWGPPGLPPRGPRQGREDAYYEEYTDQQQQRQWFPAQGPADGRYSRGHSGDYDSEKYTTGDGEHVYQAREGQYNNPPAYVAQTAYSQQALPYETQGRASQSAAGLANMAMRFMGSTQADGDGKNNKNGKRGNASDLLNEFLRK